MFCDIQIFTQRASTVPQTRSVYAEPPGTVAAVASCVRGTQICCTKRLALNLMFCNMLLKGVQFMDIIVYFESGKPTASSI